MSKVNLDEIKVGDLVSNYCSIMDRTDLGIVTKVIGEEVYAIWSCFISTQSDYRVNYKELEGHWKVINFEEETNMDELKVYTGKETLQALLEGKVLQRISTSSLYKLEDKHLSLKQPEDKGFSKAHNGMSELMNYEFTEVATPQVGDWVRVTQGDHTTTGQITSIEDDCFWAKWDIGSKGYYRTYSTGVTWEILSPEQVSEYKREQAFVKVGRKPNEFREGDIVAVDAKGVYGVVVSKNSTHEVRVNEFNTPLKGYRALPHQLTPISFVEQQVSLD